MRRLFVAATVAAALTGSALVPTVAHAAPMPAPPYVDHAEWAHWGDLSSLRVYPTRAGREASLQPNADAQGAEAWSEVLALSPDADAPGMRQQFMCHWHFAELGQPGKTSWNLEPWRPVVNDDAMIAAGCNPGGTEEPF